MEAGLGARHPVFPLQALGAHGGFIAIGDRGIGQALAQRLQGEHAEALGGFMRNEIGVARDVREVFDDDARVINTVAVVGFQHRDLADGRKTGELGIDLGGPHRLHHVLQLVAKANLMGGDDGHADEG